MFPEPQWEPRLDTSSGLRLVIAMTPPGSVQAGLTCYSINLSFADQRLE